MAVVNFDISKRSKNKTFCINQLENKLLNKII
jgi:hypothetical protein